MGGLGVGWREEQEDTKYRTNLSKGTEPREQDALEGLVSMLVKEVRACEFLFIDEIKSHLKFLKKKFALIL